MAKPVYKLSASLEGHTGEVRAVATFSDGRIVSTSRDKTARVWKPNNVANGDSNNYETVSVLKGHTNYVTAICIIEKSSLYPQGVILTGCNDSYIYVYEAGQEQPVHKLKAHEGAVCKLAKTVHCTDKFLSSSWDHTAKLWNLADLGRPVLHFVGHKAAVWCVVEFNPTSILTGSADKSIMVWENDGTSSRRLLGHTDCVRDILPITNDQFLSCANDTTIRRWSLSELRCLGVFYGHENYIYSIAATPKCTSIFSSGEDASIRVWEFNEQLAQTIDMPAQSIWCITLLPNGDIVCGCSDSIVRIFSCNPGRYANKETLALFERDVNCMKLSNSGAVGEIKVNDLPDASALLQPGQKDGQTKLVKENGAANAYSWSESEQKWVQIGEVMGVAGNGSKGAKQLYNGVEFDHVFNVDIQDGVPPIKLPYNKGQDPWLVAQKFIDSYQLSQLYLEQVANFIIKNSTGETTVTPNASYADPFTGTSRYIPSSSLPKSVGEGPLKTPKTNYGPSASNPYFPHSTYLRMDSANLSAIAKKLRELNATQTGPNRLAEEKLESIIKLGSLQTQEAMTPDDLSNLRILLNWPDDKVFPVLDILRIAILREDVQKQISADDLLTVVLRYRNPDADKNNQMLVFRLMANMFWYEQGEKLCLSWKKDILSLLIDNKLENKYIQVAVSTYLLNLVVAMLKYNDTPGQLLCSRTIMAKLPCLTDAEAMIRMLVAVATLMTENYQIIVEDIRSYPGWDTIRELANKQGPTSHSRKVEECAKLILQTIRSF